jgi:hypothetical protein
MSNTMRTVLDSSMGFMQGNEDQMNILEPPAELQEFIRRRGKRRAKVHLNQTVRPYVESVPRYGKKKKRKSSLSKELSGTLRTLRVTSTPPLVRRQREREAKRNQEI